MFITQNVPDLRVLLQEVNRVSEELGLKISKVKSKVMLLNTPEKLEMLEGIEVVADMKYLGILLCNKRECFRLHKEEKMRESHLCKYDILSCVQGL